MPGPAASPEQLSFRERQKYFELEVRVPQAEGPPKRVSLVGADDLRKMQEEEGEGCGSGRSLDMAAWPGLTQLSPTARKLQQKRAQILQEEAAAVGPNMGLPLDGETPDEEQQEDEPPWAPPSPAGG